MDEMIFVDMVNELKRIANALEEFNRHNKPQEPDGDWPPLGDEETTG